MFLVPQIERTSIFVFLHFILYYLKDLTNFTKVSESVYYSGMVKSSMEKFLTHSRTSESSHGTGYAKSSMCYSTTILTDVIGPRSYPGMRVTLTVRAHGNILPPG